LFFLLVAGPVMGQSLVQTDNFSINPEESAAFQFGGAVSRAALPPTDLLALPEESPRLRLSAPRLIRETSEMVQRTAYGGLRLYFGEAWTEGEEVYQLGTDITRGQTTAGLSVIYEDDQQDLTSSELYLDYALTDHLSIGISGILSDDLTEDASPVPQLGLNAALTSGNGTFLQGGISDTNANAPVFGLAIGLRF
jgi:hypothetical protein